MKSNMYFENSPWERILKMLSDVPVSSIRQISLLITSTKSGYQNKIDSWQNELSSLLGQPSNMDIISSDLATSIVAKYHNGTIARIFIDCGQNEDSENIEIVTAEQLIIWKPISSPQAYISDYGIDNVQVRSSNAHELAKEDIT